MPTDNSLKTYTNALQTLQVTEYRYLITARFFYIMALRMVTTVVGWRIYELTHNPFAIGLLGLSEFLPAFVLALYAGHVIDKSDKRQLLTRTTFYYLLCAVALIGISTPYFSSRVSVPWIQYSIYIVIFCSGVIRLLPGLPSPPSSRRSCPGSSWPAQSPSIPACFCWLR